MSDSSPKRYPISNTRKRITKIAALITALSMPVLACAHEERYFPVKQHLPLASHHHGSVSAPPPQFSIPPLFNPPKVMSFQPNDRVVFVGDSITALGSSYSGGWCQLVKFWAQNNNPSLNLQFFFSGVAGNKIEDVVARFYNTVLVYHPTVIVLFIGVNNADTKGYSDLGNFNNCLYWIATVSGQAGVRAILLMTPAVHGERFEGQNIYDPFLDAYAQEIRNFAAVSHNPLLDTREVFVTSEYHYNPNDLPEGVFTIDSLHPNQNGEYLFAGSVLKAFGD